MEVLWENLQFWKNPKKTPNYQLSRSLAEITRVEITSGSYAGVIYSYGRIKFDDSFGYPKLSFGFTIHHSGNHSEEHLNDDAKFVTIMGDILTELIIKNEQTRNDDTEESHI